MFKRRRKELEQSRLEKLDAFKGNKDAANISKAKISKFNYAMENLAASTTNSLTVTTQYFRGDHD